MKHLFIICFLFIVCPLLPAQIRDMLFIFDEKFYAGDTIQLTEINLFGKECSFADLEAQKRYLLLRGRVKRVYPYAKMVADRLSAMQHTMDVIQNNRQKRVYIRRTQHYIEEHFTDELKKLSRSQGRIPIRLIHRQTGRTTYSPVKELCNGWNAYWYNKTAWLYDLSPKKEYDPHNVEEDYWIGEIILRAIDRGELEPQVPALRFNFIELTEKCKKHLSDN